MTHLAIARMAELSSPAAVVEIATAAPWVRKCPLALGAWATLGRVLSKGSIECRTRKCARQRAAWLATRARFPEANGIQRNARMLYPYHAPPTSRPYCHACLSFFTTRSIRNAGEIRGS